MSDEEKYTPITDDDIANWRRTANPANHAYASSVRVALLSACKALEGQREELRLLRAVIDAACLAPTMEPAVRTAIEAWRAHVGLSPMEAPPPEEEPVRKGQGAGGERE